MRHAPFSYLLPLCGLMILASSAASEAAPVTAKKANDFVEKMAVIRGADGATMADVGFRHTRDNVIGGYNPDFTHNISDYNQYGIRLMTAVIPGTPAGVLNTTKTAFPPGVIELIEGPNEVDLWPRPYNGLNYGDAAYAWQKDFYPLFKADPATASIPIASFTYANWHYYGERGPLDNYFEFSNMHHYFWNDNIRDDKIDSMISNANKFTTPGATPKPIVVGEFGWTTGGGDHPLSEKAQAKYIPRGFIKYFGRDQIRRSYLYNMVDRHGQKYGLMRENLTKKPSYFAVKNLIGELQEGSWNTTSKTWSIPNFTPGSLDFSLSGSNLANIKTVLLQKSTGEFYLLMYQDVNVCTVVSDPNVVATDISNADVPVTLSFGTNLSNASLKKQNDDGSYSTVAVNLSGAAGAQTCTVNVPDSLLILKLTPATGTQVVANGTYKLLARHSGKALDVEGGLNATNDGDNVHQYADNGAANQQWIVEATNNGYYTLTARHSGRRLSVNTNSATNGSGTSTGNGANVFQQNTNADNQRQWKIESVGGGYYKLINRLTGRALDVFGGPTATGNDTNIHQWDYLGQTNQQWSLVKISTSTARLATTSVSGS